MNLNEHIKEKIEKSMISPIILNHTFLDDEQLTREEQLKVLEEIFDQNIREKEIGEIITHFAPMLRNHNPIHFSILGKTGTGKTATVLLMMEHLQHAAKEKGLEVRFMHLDLSVPRPCFRALNDLACLLNASKRYVKGISVDEMGGRIEESLAAYQGFLVLFIDEIDHVTRDLDSFLKFLVRRLPQAIPAKLVLVFASNKLDWRKDLDSRVKSFLKLNEIIFQPYNALDLQKILRVRVTKALNPALLEEGVIEKIAALASREHGDARKAVELLARAARLAETKGEKITLTLVDEAYDALELDSYLEFIKTAPQQLQAVLLGVLDCPQATHGSSASSEVYTSYEKVCVAHGVTQLTQRRFTDLVMELELYGFLRAQNVSQGRYRRKKELCILIPEDIARRVKSTIRLHLSGDHAPRP